MLYQVGRVGLEEERVVKPGTEKNKKPTQILRNFTDLPPFIPFQLKQDNEANKSTLQHQNNDHSLIQNSYEEGKENLHQQHQNHQHHPSNVQVEQLRRLNLEDTVHRNLLLEQVELITVKKILYAKKIAIIYNPNSGKKVNIKQVVSKKLDAAKILHEFLPSQRYFHTFELAQQLNIDDYSAIVAVGGDGSLHEVVNGMLHRPDKRRLPIAFIPNGSGNDMCATMMIDSIDRALNYIIKGDIIRIDINKVLIDCENEESIPDVDKTLNLRYSIINSNFSTPAKVAHAAVYYKRCCGGKAYEIAALREFLRIKRDKFDVYIDEQLYLENMETVIIMGFNGKVSGGGLYISPYAVINDGLMDLTLSTEDMSVKQLVTLLDNAKKGGIVGYDKKLHFIRAKTVRLVNKNPQKKGQKGPNW